MEDDEEIRSHHSPAVEENDGNNNDDEYDSNSSSPSSSTSLHSNSRITVTVASSIPHPQPPPATTISPSRSSIPTTTIITPPHNTLTLALPIQNPRPTPHSSNTGKSSNPGGGGSSGGGGGREDCWSEGATGVLIEAWGERFMQLSRGNLKQKHWQEVAEIVNARDGHAITKTAKTDVQCKNRIDTVKKKYKSEKAKISSGAAVSSNWRFFDRLDSLIAPSPLLNLPPLGNQRVPVGIPVGRPIIHNHQPTPVTKKYKPISSFSSPDDFNQRNTNDVDNKPRLKRPAATAGSDSPDSKDSFPPGVYGGSKRMRTEQLGGGSTGIAGVGRKMLSGKQTVKDWGKSVMELTRAIVRFGEVYEQAEEAKLEQMVEMEKQRMKFAKELELKRMKFLMKTQMELSRLRRCSVNGEVDGGGGGVDGNHHRNKLQRNILGNNDDNRNYNNVNNSDSSN